jgi:hypothetical protein
MTDSPPCLGKRNPKESDFEQTGTFLFLLRRYKWGYDCGRVYEVNWLFLMQTGASPPLVNGRKKTGALLAGSNSARISVLA